MRSSMEALASNDGLPSEEPAERSSNAKKLRRIVLFASKEVEDAYTKAVEAAQTAFLSGNPSEARTKAMDALRIAPTAQLFALLAAICEQEGNHDGAVDFRLLQAFFARDVVLWKELLYEFLNAGHLFKASLCLRRWAAAETDRDKRRELRLQLADLYISLGEWMRANSVLLELWRSSDHQDFEVLALIATLYFQLGRLRALATIVAEAREHLVTETGGGQVSGADHVKRLLTFANIEAELFIEEGQYQRAIDAVRMTAATLRVPLEELHPDLLVRYAVANAFAGSNTVAHNTIRAILSSASVDDFVDVLYDAAVAFIKIGQYTEALEVLQHILGSSELTSSMALHYSMGQCHAAMGSIGEALQSFEQVVASEKGHAEARIELSKIYMELGDCSAAEQILLREETDDALARVRLDRRLLEVYDSQHKHRELITAGLPLFALLLQGDDDAESVATGATRKRRRDVLLPNSVRSSSAIVPAFSIACAMNPTARSPSQSTAAMSVDAAFRSRGAARSIALARTGAAVSASNVGGTATTIGGATGGLHAAQLNESSAIFSFRRHRKQIKSLRATAVTRQGHRGPPKYRRVAPSRIADAACQAQEDLESIGNLKDLLDEGGDAFMAPPEPIEPQATDTTENLNRNRVDAEGFAIPDPVVPSAQPESEEPSSYSLPSLDEIAAKCFDDPTMAALFLDVSTVNPMKPRGPNKLEEMRAQHEAYLNNKAPSRHDVQQLLGTSGIVWLCTKLFEAYEAIGMLDDARQVGRLTLARIQPRRKAHLFHSIRVALVRLAIRSGETEDAAKYAVQLLDDAMSGGKEVCRLLNNIIALKDRSRILDRLLSQRGPEPLLLSILANRYFNSSSYRHALPLYFACLAQAPQDPLLHLQIGLCYLFLSRSKRTVERHAAVVHAWAYLQRYGALSIEADPSKKGEVAYNMGRAYQYLGLDYGAVQKYDEVLAMDSTQASAQLKACAATNLFTIYSAAGNVDLAIAVSQRHPLPLGDEAAAP